MPRSISCYAVSMVRGLLGLIVLGAACAAPSPPVASPASSTAPGGPRAFAGFSFAVPPGRVIANVASYASGQYEVEPTDGALRSVLVRWSPGSVEPEELDVSIQQFRAQGVEATPELLPGPAGTQIPTVVMPSATETHWLSAFECGTRTIYLDSYGTDLAPHAAIVRTFACHPDPAREPALGVIRLALDLPHFFTQPGGRYEGQLHLTDNVAINLILVESSAGTGFDPKQDLFSVENLVMEPEIRGRIPYSGVEGGQEVRGFIVNKECVTFRATIIAYAPVNHAKQLASLVEPIASARCLDEGEPPPTWPDAPPR